MAKCQIKKKDGGIFEAEMATVKKNQLLVSEDTNFKIWGISSHEKPARFAWFINKMRELDFFRIDDFTLRKRKSQESFLQFFAADELKLCDYILLKNYSGASYLIPDFKAIDYILMIRYEEDPPDFDPISAFSKLPVVQVCFQIEIDHLKSSTKNDLYELYEHNYKAH